jgi:CheY-like chemotaxis protein
MSSTPSPRASGSGPKPRILIVDDEPSVCAVLVSLLTNLGYEPVAMVDPQAALRLMEVRDSRPDVLITDFAMPHMSGLELIRRGRALQPQLKTILASGEIDQPDTPVEARPDAYLEKPFSTRALAGLLHSLLESDANPAAQRPVDPAGP